MGKAVFLLGGPVCMEADSDPWTPCGPVDSLALRFVLEAYKLRSAKLEEVQQAAESQIVDLTKRKKKKKGPKVRSVDCFFPPAQRPGPMDQDPTQDAVEHSLSPHDTNHNTNVTSTFVPAFAGGGSHSLMATDYD